MKNWNATHWSAIFFAGLLVAGCAQLSSVTDRAGDVSERASDVRETTQEAREQVDETREQVDDAREQVEEVRDEDNPLAVPEPELTPNERSAIQLAESLERDCPAEDSHYTDQELSLSERQSRLNSCERNFHQTQRRVDSIDGETHRRNERYRNVVSYMESMEAGIPEWRASLEEDMLADQELRDMANEYARLLGHRSPNSGMIVTLWEYREGAQHEEYNRLDVGRLASMAEDATEPCQERFLVSDEEFTTYEEDNPLHPKNACQVVLEWQDFAMPYMMSYGVFRAGWRLEGLKNNAERVRETGRFTDHSRDRMDNMDAAIEEWITPITEDFEALGHPVPDEIVAAFDELHRGAEAIREAHDAAITQNRWDVDFNGQHRDVAGTLRSFLQENGMEVVQYALYSSDGQINYEFGNPVSRSHRGWVLARSGDFCRVYQFFTVAQYDGNNYQTPAIRLSPNHDLYLLSSCR